MKALILGLVAVFVIAVTADLVLDRLGFDSASQGSSSNAVRLD